MITPGWTIDQHALGTGGLHPSRAEGVADGSRTDVGVPSAADRVAVPSERALAFGTFRLLLARRLLLQGDGPVRLGSRALEILIALVERPGELVTKTELMARVWPSVFVEESNLKVQVAGLRRALGDRRAAIAIWPRFPAAATASSLRSPRSRELPAPQAAVEEAHDLPAPCPHDRPRRNRGSDHRPTAAPALHHHRRPRRNRQDHGCARGRQGPERSARAPSYIRRLGAVVDPRLVPSALADALGAEIRSEHSIRGLIAALKDRPMLLMLDNCEHVIEAAAALGVEVLNAAPAVQILATSREPLRVESEQVHRLPPLESPPPSAGLTAEAALGFSAVQLFVERAAAILGDFELHDEDAPIVAAICRKLDGVPLAIEFAAARIDAFGVRGLAVHLDDRLQLLTGGRRLARPRHHSLRASLDWGHDLLPEPERVVLRRVAIFAGGFTLGAAKAVAASAEIAAPEVVECIANLVTKSLIEADLDGAVPRYRLLKTTQAYALEKLSESGDFERRASPRQYLRNLVRRPELGWDMPPAAERLAGCGRRIDVARAGRTFRLWTTPQAVPRSPSVRWPATVGPG